MPKRPLLIPDFPHSLHGGDYNPDQWLHEPGVIDEDFRLMKLARCNTFTLGVFALTSYERSEGAFDFSGPATNDGTFPAEPSIQAAWYYGTEKYPGITAELMAERDVEELLEED